MNKLNRLKKIEEKNNVVKETESFDLVGKSLEDQNKVIDETTRVAEFLNDTPDILEDIDREFMKRTGITNKTDLMVLFLATGLQVVRQEIFAAKINKYTKSSRLSDKEAAENSHGGVKDKINRDLRRKGYYHTTVAEIDSNPVPFDTQNNSKMFGENLGGGKGHRFSTLGHDPILGWIFGTANIATRTVTTTTLMSYHVQYGIIPGGKNNNDFFAHHADTLKVLQIGLLDSIKSPENFEILIHSLIQEGRHLNSDVRSKQGLGIPFVALQDPKIAEKLNDYGLDLYNLKTVGSQAGWAHIINTIIAMLHRLTLKNDSEEDERLLKIRTETILTYSNLMASSINITSVLITSNVNRLDIGGILITISQVFRDINFRRRVERDFIKENWSKELFKYELKIEDRT